MGAIAGESGIPGKMIGSIDMYDRYTFVDVPRGQVSAIIKAMKKSKIKGKSVNVERANNASNS